MRSTSLSRRSTMRRCSTPAPATSRPYLFLPLMSLARRPFQSLQTGCRTQGRHRSPSFGHHPSTRPALEAPFERRDCAAGKARSAPSRVDSRSLLMANQVNQACIAACNSCADACDLCSTACLQEQDVKMMARCIALDIDCAAICRLSAAYMARGSEFAAQLCRVCATICQACGDECSKHQAEHCQACATACRQCAEECGRMAA